MEAVANTLFSFSPPLQSSPFQSQKTALFFSPPKKSTRKKSPNICCQLPENKTEVTLSKQGSSISGSKSKTEEYNIAMKKLMMNPFEYHHEFG